MAPTTERILKSFDYIIADIHCLLRSHQSLTESEQLFFENRLMVLQMEYYRWAQRPLDIVCRSKTDQAPSASKLVAIVGKAR